MDFIGLKGFGLNEYLTYYETQITLGFWFGLWLSILLSQREIMPQIWDHAKELMIDGFCGGIRHAKKDGAELHPKESTCPKNSYP